MLLKRHNPRPKSRRFDGNNGSLFAVLFLSALVFIVIVLVFSIAAAVSLRSNLSERYFAAGQDASLFEIHNHFGTQPPSNFPPQLILGRVGGLISSQEMNSPALGELKFVSFFSRIACQLLAGYYKNYLENNAYYLKGPQGGEISQLFAYRGKMSYDISIQPQADGSIVTIYQRITK